jgi:ribosomal protein S18 acetylase RimI-like enzyme
MLFVDKDNTAAIATYVKLGFTVHHEEQAFIGEIASTAKQT